MLGKKAREAASRESGVSRQVSVQGPGKGFIYRKGSQEIMGRLSVHIVEHSVPSYP